MNRIKTEKPNISWVATLVCLKFTISLRGWPAATDGRRRVDDDSGAGARPARESGSAVRMGSGGSALNFNGSLAQIQDEFDEVMPNGNTLSIMLINA
ncbi:hypothetical protein [Herbaspirillum huttiense]|uniref:hypothetical protein n=1 Tax=Herbaspirillum huttiense TaxID=863372 RepID=UPI001416F7F6|nr:hypothetical protein [Herbaspirillum huttiense]